jgi:alpha-tubulin suppressor-like RCC1 family protein
VGFVDVSAGVGFTCASRVDGSLFCWGDNSGSQLAVTGTKATYFSTPAQVPGSLWKGVSAGQIHACAAGGDGSLACWGGDDSGQLGDNKASKNGAKAVLPGNLWASVGAGYYHTCATKTDNSLWCWGQNFSGQVGDGTTSDRVLPTQVSGSDPDAGSSSDWSQIAVGYLHNCAIKLDSTLYCWGGNGQGQLGLGTTLFQMQPAPVGGATDWTTVSVGYQHTCGIHQGGRLWCWGDNGTSQLGGSSATQESKPVQVGDTADWVAVSAGQGHTCAIKADGSLWCWGDNSKGELGDGSLVNRPLPTQVTEPAGSWYKVAAGASHTCGVQSAGSLWCWGDNSKGQLGNGSTVNRPRPVLIN